MTLNGMRIIENPNLTVAGTPCVMWRPCGGGWSVKRMYTPQIPYPGAYQLNASTLVMHPETLRALKRADR